VKTVGAIFGGCATLPEMPNCWKQVSDVRKKESESEGRLSGNSWVSRCGVTEYGPRRQK